MTHPRHREPPFLAVMTDEQAQRMVNGETAMPNYRDQKTRPLAALMKEQVQADPSLRAASPVQAANPPKPDTNPAVASMLKILGK